jgi:CBS domain containing-hemolysin-like protein
MSWLVILLVVSLLLAAFAAASETALTSVSRLRMRSLAEEGNRHAAVVVRLHNDPNAYLSTILSVNTVAVIVASTTATLIIANTYRSFPEAAGTAILSAIVLVFCEIAPKSLALRFNERLALVLGRPVEALTRLLRPVVGLLTLVSNSLLRAATRGQNVVGPFVTEEELKLMLHLSQQQGVVEYGEQEMIHGILEMTDKTVREVMVPRIDVVAIETSSTVTELIDLVVKFGHSRIPVYEGSMDNIAGVVYAKDLLRARARSGDQRKVTTLMREPYFTPEVKHVGELLKEMQQRKVHMAVVVEEHGGTAGIVTFEDLIEEIVGPIRDEYDLGEQEEVQFLNDCEVLLNARVPVDDLKDLLHIDIGETESDSIGGLVYERLGKIPSVGDTLQLDDAVLTVEQVRRQSIQLVRITSPHAFLRDSNGTVTPLPGIEQRGDSGTSSVTV